MQHYLSRQFLVFLGLTMIIAARADGQQNTYHVQFFDEDHGIRTGNYQGIDITKDSAGFLWILQTTTVQRFDGKQVADFSFDETLGSILCDRQGRIWVSSDTKVWRFDDRSRKFRTVEFEDGAKVIPGTVFSFKEKEVWLHTTSGFFEFDEQQQQFRRVLTQVPQTRDISRRDFAHFNNVLYFQVFDTLFCYDINRGMKGGLLKPPGIGIFSVSEDLVLFTSWQFHSYWHDFNKKETRPALAPFTYKEAAGTLLYIRDVKRLDPQHIIVGTQLGIFEYNLEKKAYKKIRFYRGGKQLTGEGLILRIYVDNEKTVWLGFPEGIAHYQHFKEGIGLMRNNEADNLNTWTSTSANFAEDDSGNIWFVNGNGFAKWDLSTNNIISYPPVQGASDRLSHPSVRGIVFDGRYIILGPTGKGLWLYEPATGKFRRPVYSKSTEGKKARTSSEGDFIDQIRTLHNGNHMIVGRDALYLLNGKTYELSIVNSPAGKENTNFVHQDLEKRIWVGTGKGLHCLDTNLAYLFRVKDTVGTMRSFCTWGANEILVSGARGIFHVGSQNGSVIVKPFHPFFQGMSVNLIYKDRNSKLWAGTNQGLYRVDSATHKMELFDYANKVQGNGFFFDASFLSSSNVLFLGGVNGINYFIPEKIEANNGILKVSIQRIRVNDNDSGFAAGPSFNLGAHQRSMEVSFTAPYYYNATKVKYRYKMEGYDKEWKTIGNSNSVLFTSLPAGRFKFRVAASIDDINWYEADQEVSFTIAPHFWQTWWFIGLVQLFLAMIVYLVYKNRLNKRLAVERFRTSISRDLHDDIGSTLSSINILARSSLVHGGDNQDQAALFQKIQQRSQKMLDAMDDLIWNTKPGNETIESLTVRMREYAGEVLESAGISFTIDCPPRLYQVKPGIAQRKNLYLVFKEAVNNLAKYSQSKNAAILFSYEKKQLQMSIQDDGIGFLTSNIKKGNGLDNMKARAGEMGGRLDVISGEGNGTLVRLIIPL